MRQYIAILRHSKTIPALVIFTFCFQLATQEMQAWTPDPQPDYKYFIIPYVEQCNLFEYPQRNDYIAIDGVPTYVDHKVPTRDPLKWWTNCLSYKISDSPKLIPTIFNVGIIPLAYLIAVSLTRDKLIGLIAVTALILNPMYTQFEGSGTYDQIWSFFLLLSAYFVLRTRDRIALSVPFLFASLSAKAIGVMYIPAIIYMILRSDRPAKSKAVICLGIIGGLAGVGLVVGAGFMVGSTISFHPENIETAVSQSIKMIWPLIPVLVIAIGINRWLAPKQKVPNKATVSIWMLCGFLTTPLIYLLSDQLQFVYRFVPFLVFFSIYIGMVIVETGNRLVEHKLKPIRI